MVIQWSNGQPNIKQFSWICFEGIDDDDDDGLSLTIEYNEVIFNFWISLVVSVLCQFVLGWFVRSMFYSVCLD